MSLMMKQCRPRNEDFWGFMMMVMEVVLCEARLDLVALSLFPHLSLASSLPDRLSIVHTA